ncbi:hypothetical protein VNO78_29011 [Psophocarpus tetragonolobus]|uniref:Uncharacterized protein n=1 Tax=Psophocarpus tetragonolobus TaxID=3891 RepID=A0AAN9RUL6_PSOTE
MNPLSLVQPFRGADTATSNVNQTLHYLFSTINGVPLRWGSRAYVSMTLVGTTPHNTHLRPTKREPHVEPHHWSVTPRKVKAPPRVTCGTSP